MYYDPEKYEDVLTFQLGSNVQTDFTTNGYKNFIVQLNGLYDTVLTGIQVLSNTGTNQIIVIESPQLQLKAYNTSGNLDYFSYYKFFLPFTNQNPGMRQRVYFGPVQFNNTINIGFMDGFTGLLPDGVDYILLDFEVRKIRGT